jgi:hypothetical protein
MVPIAVAGTDRVMGRGGGRIKRAPVRVVVCEPIDPRDYASAGEMTEVWRRRVDAVLREL